MKPEIIAIFAFLGLLVLGLSLYLGVLYGKLRARKKELEEARIGAEKAWAERELKIKDSLRTLALVIIQEQCEPTEGCIRVKKLMDEVAFLKDREELVVFHKMYEEVKDFAILQDYKDLSSQEKFVQDNKRFALEQKYSDSLKEASESLKKILDLEG